MSALGATPGPILNAPGGVDARVVRTGVRRPAGGDAEAGGRAGHVRSMAEAVERVRVGMGHAIRIGVREVCVVSVADEIETALHLGRGRAELRRICSHGVRGVRCVVGGDRSQAHRNWHACSRYPCR